jgi:hypothetical protein
MKDHPLHEQAMFTNPDALNYILKVSCVRHLGYFLFSVLVKYP